MTDRELIELAEQRTYHAMLMGCHIWTNAHGLLKADYAQDVGAWAVSLRADAMSRLIDLAKAGLEKA